MPVEPALHNFAKGMHKDSSVLNQPEGTYRDALNITLLNDRGEYHSLCNEKGTSTHVSIPDGYNVIGHTIVDDEVVLCLVNSRDNLSQIGVVKEGTYTQKIPVAGENNDLEFDINNPIDLKGKKFFNGDTIVYLAGANNKIRTINLDDPAENVNTGIYLSPEVSLPVITYDEILEGGNLTAGVYQFMVRYLNKELVPTATFLASDPIPIIGSEDITPITKVFGADFEEERNKSIKFTIDNIDTDFPYLEVIAVGYEGATSAPVAYIIETYNITSSSRTVIYSGQDDDSVPITIEELQALPVSYDEAKCVEYKDGIVFYSNLKESTSKYRDELQSIANDMVLTYSVSNENEDYYANPLNCATKKTYKRGEVYSFGLGVVFKDGSTSFVYHIPAPDVFGAAGTIARPADTTTKVLGTYLSSEEYPLNQDYPTGANTPYVRHHVMPTTEQELHYTGQSTVRPLTVNFAFGSTLPSQDLKNDIQGFVLFREQRNTPNKRSMLSQGFITNFYLGASEYESDEKDVLDSGKVLQRGMVINNSYHYRKNIGFFNMKLNTYYNLDSASFFVVNVFAESYKGGGDVIRTKFKSSHGGFYYSVKTLDKSIVPYKSGGAVTFDETDYQELDWRMETDRFSFFSPETLLSDGVFLDKDEVVGGELYKLLSCNTSMSPSPSGNRINQSSFDTHNLKEFIAISGNWNAIFVFNNPYSYEETGETIIDSAYVNNGQKIKLSGFNFEYDNTYGGKALYIRTANNLLQNVNTAENFIDTDFPLDYSAGGTTFNGISELGSASANIELKNDLDMYEIKSVKRNQYGNIDSSQYIPIHTELDIEATSFNGIGNGDIFITEYTAINKNIFSRYFPFRTSSYEYRYFQENYKDAADGETRIVTTTTVNENNYSPKTIPGNCYQTAVRYFVESKINCYYRFRGENGVPYSPNSLIGDVWNAIPQQEDNRNYNVQYSLENNLKTTYVTRPIFDETISLYPNRTIYSQTSAEDDRTDFNQIFLQNNFYDLPEDTGGIMDTFVWNNTLYSHTPKALWQNFTNQVTREANSIGEIVIGTGGLFRQPSQKVISSSGGYGGTISQWGNVETPFGYFFVDLLQKKVFKLTQTLDEISLNGMQQYFDENLIAPSSYEDNPFNETGAIGVNMGWDNEYKRVLLTHHNTENFPTTVDTFTASYSPLIKGWVSFHSYTPNVYVAFDKSMFSVINNPLSTATYEEHNVGDYGIYHQSGIQNAELEMVCNKLPIYEKVFDNFNIHSRSYNSSGILQEFDNFTTIQCFNDYQDSGTLNILVDNSFNPTIANNEILCRWKKSHYQLYIPRDSQENNLDSADGWKEASRLKSKYLQVKLVYDNLNNREFIVNFIEYLYRIVAR